MIAARDIHPVCIRRVAGEQRRRLAARQDNAQGAVGYVGDTGQRSLLFHPLEWDDADKRSCDSGTRIPRVRHRVVRHGDIDRR